MHHPAAGFGHKGGEAAKAKGAGIMANPSEYGRKGGKARGTGNVEEEEVEEE